MHAIRIILASLVILIFSCNEKDGIESGSKDYPDTQAWWKDEVFYQLFVRSFYDSDGDGNGDLQGIIQKLDYLNDGDPLTSNDLGVTGLVLMPVFKSTTYDGYAVEDFLEIDETYGTTQDLQQLITLSKQRGIRIILDFPINHTSDQHPWFLNSASEIQGLYRDWYIWKKENPDTNSPYGGPLWHPSGNEFYYGLFGRGKPDLNFKNPQVTDELKRISQFWLKGIGIDGFRMEGAGALIEDETNIMFTADNLIWWRDYFSFIRKQDPSFFLIGDLQGLTGTTVPYTRDRLDLCYEYELSAAIFSSIKNRTAIMLRDKMVDVLNRYPSLQWGIFLTNQFQNRTSDLLDDLEQLKLASSILLTIPGVPFIYYGEEIGMSGSGKGEEIRKPMQWSGNPQAGFTSGIPWYPVDKNYLNINIGKQEADPASLLSHYRDLIRIRYASQALRRGSFEPVKSSDSRILSFFRIGNSEIVLAVHNLSPTIISNPSFSNQDGSLPAGTYFGKYMDSGDLAPDLRLESGGSFISYIPVNELKPYQTILIRFQRREQ